MVVGLREKVREWKGERRDKTAKEGRVGNSSKSVFKENKFIISPQKVFRITFKMEIFLLLFLSKLHQYTIIHPISQPSFDEPQNSATILFHCFSFFFSFFPFILGCFIERRKPKVRGDFYCPEKTKKFKIYEKTI